MQSEEFNKLFTNEFGKAKMAKLDKRMIESLNQKLEKNDLLGARQVIEKNEEPVPEVMSKRIQRFIAKKRKQGVGEVQIKKIVERKFKIVVV